MALIGDEYAVFTDAGLVERPTRIAFKWPFLPEEFTHDIDSAAVYFSGNGFRWQRRWTKGNRMITFEDSGIIREQTLPVGKYDAYAGFNYNGKYCCVFTMATYGDRYTAWMEQFPGQPIFGTEYPLALRFPYIPAHFTFDLDDISIESDGNAYSFYKGNERIVFDAPPRLRPGRRRGGDFRDWVAWGFPVPDGGLHADGPRCGVTAGRHQFTHMAGGDCRAARARLRLAGRDPVNPIWWPVRWTGLFVPRGGCPHSL